MKKVGGDVWRSYRKIPYESFLPGVFGSGVELLGCFRQVCELLLLPMQDRLEVILS